MRSRSGHGALDEGRKRNGRPRRSHWRKHRHHKGGRGAARSNSIHPGGTSRRRRHPVCPLFSAFVCFACSWFVLPVGAFDVVMCGCVFVCSMVLCVFSCFLFRVCFLLHMAVCLCVHIFFSCLCFVCNFCVCEFFCVACSVCDCVCFAFFVCLMPCVCVFACCVCFCIRVLLALLQRQKNAVDVVEMCGLIKCLSIV